jgi:hypothetical protein
MSGFARIRKHPALLLLAAFVLTSIGFISCGGNYDPDEGEEQVGARKSCVPFTVRKCRGPAGCVGAQTCLATGDGYTPCVCLSDFDASQDAPVSNDGSMSNDAPSSGDAPDSGDAPGSGDAPDSGDAPSSGDAGDDAPSSNGWGLLEWLDSVR